MIANRLRTLYQDLETTAIQCGREPSRIKVVAVSKRFPVQAILEAFAAGQRLFGENYLQEAAEKRARLPESIRLHLIGHLQSNKAKTAASVFSMIETIDRLKIAETLNRHLLDLQRSMEVLIQVNIGRDPKKAGVLPEQTEELLRSMADLSQLHVKGLMTIPPWRDDPEDSRHFFRDLRLLADQLKHKGLFTGNDDCELSMGMSHDYRVAIQEGATIIRVGTAIFGERPRETVS